MTWLIPLVLSLAMQQPVAIIPAPLKEATVVFYSHGSFLTSGLPGAKHGIWNGSVFDGNDGMFVFDTSFFQTNNHYIVLHLPAGHHVFSPTSKNRPDPQSLLEVDLNAGQLYFIRAQSESSGILVVEVEHGRLDQITCPVAHEEMTKMSHVKEKSIWKKYKSRPSPDQSIPDCQ